MLNKILRNKYIKWVVGIISITSAIITIYSFFTQNKKIDFECQIITNSNVFDIHTELNDLDFSYKGVSLKESNKKLRIYQLKFVNNGSEPITMNNYDPNLPLGIDIQNGRIVDKPTLIEASSEYLRNMLEFKFDSTGIVTFSPVIFDKGSFLIIKFLVLHSPQSVPTIKITGKIAGQETIDVIDLVENSNGNSFWKTALSGNLLIHLVRIIVYAFYSILYFIFFVILLMFFSYQISKFKHKKHITKFKRQAKYEYKTVDEVIFHRYIEDGYEVISKMYAHLQDNERLEQNYKKLNKEMNPGNTSYLNNHYYNKNKDTINNIDEFKKLIDDGIIEDNNGKIIVNNRLENVLKQVLSFLDEKYNLNTKGAKTNHISEDNNSQGSITTPKEKVASSND